MAQENPTPTNQATNGESLYSSAEAILREAEQASFDVRRPTSTGQSDIESKRTGTRRKRKPKPSDVPIEIAPDAFGMLWQKLTQYLALRMGHSRWQATELESKQIGAALDKVACKYFPLLMGYQEEAALGLLVLGYLAVRLEFKPEPVASTDNGANGD